jgi:hypothetical protein
MRRMPPLNDANGIVMVLQALGWEHVAAALADLLLRMESQARERLRNRDGACCASKGR